MQSKKSFWAILGASFYVIAGLMYLFILLFNSLKIKLLASLLNMKGVGSFIIGMLKAGFWTMAIICFVSAIIGFIASRKKAATPSAVFLIVIGAITCVIILPIMFIDTGARHVALLCAAIPYLVYGFSNKK